MVSRTGIIRNIATKVTEASTAAQVPKSQPIAAAAAAATTAVFNPINYRSWYDIDPSVDTKIPPERKFTMLSYNLLNQSYIWPKVYDNYVDPAHKDWNYRLDLLKKSLTHSSLKSDVMFFQEMDLRTFRDVWKPMFETLGYGCEYKQKGKPAYWDAHALLDDSIDDDSIDGVSTMYNKSKFEKLETVAFNFSDQYKEMMKDQHIFYGINLNLELLEADLKERNQVAMIVVLKHIATQKVIITANTHLYWKRESMQFIQNLILLALLKKLKSKYGNRSTVLYGGDLNSKPLSSVYEFMTNKEINVHKYNTLARYLRANHRKHKVKNPIKAASNFYQSLSRVQQFKKETDRVSELYTCHTEEFSNVLDYVFYNEKQLKLTRILTGLKQQYTESIRGLPNDEFPSDHIPIRGEFAVKVKNRNKNK
jgi:mRNA deadenylase 3'-5' endonuclease subunit Ccr4